MASPTWMTRAAADMMQETCIKIQSLERIVWRYWAMIVDEVVDEIGNIRGITRLDEEIFDDPPRHSLEQKAKEFERWSSATGLSKVDLVNEIAKVVAVEFDAGRITFAFGDAIMNYLLSVINEALMGDDSLPWNVYLAFDLGEYTPYETSTVPMIAKIVQNLR